jgi:hypothetical protein
MHKYYQKEKLQVYNYMRFEEGVNIRIHIDTEKVLLEFLGYLDNYEVNE